MGTYLLSAMFLDGFVEGKESGIRNAEFPIFQILTC